MSGHTPRGSSDPLQILFLPGLLCDEAVWNDLSASLDDRAICTVADYGAADSLPRMAETVLERVPGKFVAVGHSMGGRVALEVYRQARERVQGLALFDTGYQAREPGDAGLREQAQRMELVERARNQGMRAMGMEWMRGMVHPDRLDDVSLMGAILGMIQRKTPSIFAAQQRSLLARPDAGPLLADIRCPTLILCGREDAWSPLARHEEMARAIVGARLVVIDHCGHMSTMEHPQAVSAALRTWLDSWQ